MASNNNNNSKREQAVLAAHDGSAHGLEAVARAREIAEAKDARLIVVHVADRQMPWSSIDRDRQHAVRDTLAHVFEPARAVGGPQAESRTVDARSVIDGLVAVIEQEDVATVVVGRSHHRWIGHLLYGDVARELERRCQCAVEVAPPRRTADAAAA